MTDDGTIEVFPISTTAFGIRPNWFELFAPMLIEPSYLLMVLLLVIAVGIMVLKQFEDADLGKKLWNIPIIIVATAFWPALVLNLKFLIDSFNTFLAYQVFQIPWRGFGFPAMGSITNIMGWSAEGLARLLPNLAYWIIYAFFLLFLFFFAVLGPFILAKGILFDEIGAFLELVVEIIVLFLWQTTLLVLVAFLLPEIVSGEPFPNNPEPNFYFLSIILGIMIFFTPTMTRKFANHLGSSFFPPGLKWGGAMLGLTALGTAAAVTFPFLGLAVPGKGKLMNWKYRILGAEEFLTRSHFVRQVRHEKEEKEEVERELARVKRRMDSPEASPLSSDFDPITFAQPPESLFPSRQRSREFFIELLRRAKREIDRNENV